MGKYSNMIEGPNPSSKMSQIQLTQPDSFEVDQKIYGSIDPRADKVIDHRYWEDILWNAWQFTKPFYQELHGIRCGGAELTLTRESFRLLPGEWSPAEWEEIKRQYLDPIKHDLIRLLRLTRFGKVTEATLPEGILDDKKKDAKPVMEQGRMFG